MNVFFWGFSVAQLSMLFIPTAIGFVIGVAISRKLHERFDKKPTLVIGAGNERVENPNPQIKAV
jgi:hypothetical protein